MFRSPSTRSEPLFTDIEQKIEHAMYKKNAISKMIKTLPYTHRCGRTWDVAERAREEELKTHANFAPPKSKYADLLAQINQTA